MIFPQFQNHLLVFQGGGAAYQHLVVPTEKKCI